MAWQGTERRVRERRGRSDRRLGTERRLAERRVFPIVLEVGQRAGEERRSDDRRAYLDCRRGGRDRRGTV